MVKLRLKRFGRRNRAYFRLNAIDTREPRDGRSIEELGFYDPLEKDATKAMKFNADRVKYWISVGAQPSATVASLLHKAGIVERKPYVPKRGAKPSTPKKPAAEKAAEAPAAAEETK